jgi:16S rRNA (cytosine1402-N4)-methyltransferase
LQPAAGQILIDCTIGRAGHAQMLAERLGPDGLLIGLDVDPRNLEFAASQIRSAPCQTRFFHANFAELADVMQACGLSAVDAILADLGISTNQITDPHYGLSFAQEMPLDMRLDPRIEKTAADLVNYLPEEKLANVLYESAQEHYSRRIARKIADARRQSPIQSTQRLAEIVRSAIPRRGGAPYRIDPATRTFMALRMAVNQESENLASLLKRAPGFLRPLGRLVVIGFQSTEDRLVKQAFANLKTAGQFAILTPKPLTPTDQEIAINPRSRSARLRAVQRLS